MGPGPGHGRDQSDNGLADAAERRFSDACAGLSGTCRLVGERIDGLEGFPRRRQTVEATDAATLARHAASGPGSIADGDADRPSSAGSSHDARQAAAAQAATTSKRPGLWADRFWFLTTCVVDPGSGQEAHSFSLAVGALSPGMSFTSAGVLSGTPNAAGTFNFALTASDSSPNRRPFTIAAVAYGLTVNAPTITVTPASLPTATTTVGYSQIVTATDGTGVPSFSLTVGRLADRAELHQRRGAVGDTTGDRDL